MRSSNDVWEVKQPLARRKVLRMRVLWPKSFEGDLVLGLLARAARFHDLVRLAVLGYLGLAQLKAQAAAVHCPNVAGNNSEVKEIDERLMNSDLHIFPLKGWTNRGKAEVHIIHLKQLKGWKDWGKACKQFKPLKSFFSFCRTLVSIFALLFARLHHMQQQCFQQIFTHGFAPNEWCMKNV